MLFAPFSRVRRPRGPILLLAGHLVGVLVLAASVGTAAGHSGHLHVVYGPPAPESAWSDPEVARVAAASQRDARGKQAFAARLEAAPVERTGGNCGETAAFAGIGDGCRTSDGLLRVELPGGGSVVTHGPDYLEAAVDADPKTMPPRMVSAIREASKEDIQCVPATERHTVLVYAIPADRISRAIDIVPELRQSAYELSAVLDREARSLDPTSGRRLRVLCDVNDEAHVEVVRLRTLSANATFATVQADLHASEGSTPSSGYERYLVFYDAHLGDYGGIGQYIADETGSAANRNNQGGRVALQDNTSGAISPNWEILLHEAAHNMGAVQDAAPDSNSVGHCNDGADVMCYAEPTTTGVTGTYDGTVCALNQFDCGHDSYFHPAPAGGSYLASSWNLAASYNGFLGTRTAPVDTTAPTAPTGVTAVGYGTFVRLGWAASTDAGTGVSAYRVHLDTGGGTWQVLDDSAVGDLGYDATWTGITANTTYTLRITAYDRLGNESAPTDVVVDTGTSDGTARSVTGGLPEPLDLHVSASTASSLSLAWQAIVAPPGARYRVQRRTGTGNWVSVVNTSGLSYTSTSLLSATRYEFRVIAYDTNGHQSVPSDIAAGWTTGSTDTTPPPAPTNLVVSAQAGTTPLLSWDPVAGVKTYVIWAEVDGVWTKVATTGFWERWGTGQPYATTRTWGVTARDEAGNGSARATVTFTSPLAPDQTPPSTAPIASATRTTTSITPTWTAATDNTGVVAYRLFVARADTGFFTLAATTGGSTLSAAATGLAPGTTYWLRVQAVDANGYGSSTSSYSIISTVADTTPPSTPTGLLASGQTTSSVDLTWNASTDASGITGYRVFRREADMSWTLLATTTARSYTVTGLDANTTYTFGVRAVDSASLESGTASVTTTTLVDVPDTLAPSQPTNLATGTITGTSAALSWTASVDDREVTGYRVYRQSPNASATPIGTPTGTSYTATGLVPATQYTMEVAAIDAAGNESTRATVTFTTPDTVAPSAPGALTASSTTETTTNLSWSASSDNVGVTGYRVERTQPTAAVLTTTTGLSFAVTGLLPGRPYTFTVTATDAAGNEATSTVSVTTADESAPSQPGGASVGTITATSVALSWSASTDNVAVTSYRVYRDAPNPSGTPIATIAAPGTSTTLGGLASETSYTFSIAARDGAGNESTRTTVAATTLDVTAPTQPTGLSTTARTTTTVTLAWNASTDSAGGAVQYRTFRREPNGSWTLLATTSQTTWQATGLSEATAYTLGVASVDGSGNQSAITYTATSTSDTTPPTQPGAIAVGTVTGTSIDLSWGASTDNVVVSGYRVYRQSPNASGTPIATPSGSSASITGLTSGVSYTFAVSAVDAAGNESATRTVTAATADVVDPTQPGNLAGVATGETTVRLTWDASTDNVGVTGYRVLRLVSGVASEVTTTTALAADLAGLAPATAYRFQVEAYDAAGRTSSRSSVDVTTPDTTAPSRPGTPTVTSTSDTNVALSWIASSDQVGVVDYRIYQTTPAAGGAPIALTAGATSVVVTGLAADTDYTFEVAAVDAAGNESPRASVAARTAALPDTTAPTQPGSLTAAPTQTTAQLSWTASSDAGGIASYRLERFAAGTWSLVGSTGATSWQLTGLAADTTYTYRVSALDAAGNESTAATVTFTTPAGADVIPPTTPFSIQASADTTGTVGLTWGASTDAVGVTGYRVYRLTDAGWILVATSATTSATATGLPAGQNIRLAVGAVDAAGNESLRATVEVQVPTLTLRGLPGAPTGLAAVATMSTLQLSWQYGTGDQPSSWTVEVLRWGTVIESRTVATPSATFGPYAPAVSLTFRVTASSASGTSPAATITASTLRDTIRPTRPARAFGFPRARGKLLVRWSPSRDNVGIARYEVRLISRGVRTRVIRVRSTARAVTVTRLQPRRTYLLTVRSVDRSGNSSPWTRMLRVRAR